MGICGQGSGVDVRRQPASLRRVPALDALRGIAILLVLVHHSGSGLAGGALGVDLFFVLSGFLITSLLVTEWNVAGRISLRSFYRRRASRLLPPLISMLAVVTVLTAIVEPAQFRNALFAAAMGITYLANVVQAAHGTLKSPG
jgi:peptidoglycan/LPS O-acetylase OafA/YrhL